MASVQPVTLIIAYFKYHIKSLILLFSHQDEHLLLLFESIRNDTPKLEDNYGRRLLSLFQTFFNALPIHDRYANELILFENQRTKKIFRFYCFLQKSASTKNSPIPTA